MHILIHCENGGHGRVELVAGIIRASSQLLLDVLLRCIFWQHAVSSSRLLDLHSREKASRALAFSTRAVESRARRLAGAQEVSDATNTTLWRPCASRVQAYAAAWFARRRAYRLPELI